MTTNNNRNSWWIVPQTNHPVQPQILAWAPESIKKDIELLDQVTAHFSNDKRVASLSLGFSPSVTKSSPIRIHQPFGNAVFVNLNLFELIGTVDQEGDPDSEIESWANQATRRGLFHYSAAWWPVDEAALIEISRADAMESTDTLTPLGAKLTTQVNRQISVLVDCAWLGETETGSQRATVEIIQEMAVDQRVSSISLYNLPNGIPAYASELKSLAKVKEVELQSWRYCDIFWRPYQPGGELNFYDVNRRARRIAITYLDLIAYSNDFYHENEESWLGYRSTLRLTAIRCDGVIAISEDVRNQIIENMPQVEPERIYSVPLGADHLKVFETDLNSRRTISGNEIFSKNYVLCLGTNFAHKNRDFAISVVDEVRNRGKEIELILAGLILDEKISGESSENMNRLSKASWIKTLGSVTAQERDWLLANASVSIYPTSAEGFGLVPFESAALGTPVVATSFGPLTELLPQQVNVASWSVNEYADAIVSYLDSSDTSQAQVMGIRESGKTLTWKTCSTKLVDAFIAIASMEKSSANIASAEFDAQLQVAQERFNIQVNAITSSISWKLTGPIRALHNKLIGK
jgi:glycosyltransferase involved in cell wall biosynthesis